MKRIARDSVQLTLDRSIPPVAEILPGETVLFETEIGCPAVLASGPVFVRGAEPGDALAVKVKKIEVLDTQYWWFEEKDIRGFRDFLGMYCKEPPTDWIPVEEGRVVFSERLSVSVKPVIGTIGVAPPGGSISATRRGTHGGNMDCKTIVEGVTILLPVYVEGALLSLGDVHAAQSDGEVLRAPESRADIIVVVDLRKGLELQGPFVETEDCLHAIGSGETMEKAFELAMTSMMDVLSKRVPLSNHEIVQFMGTSVDTNICQLIGSEITLRVSLEKRLFPGLLL